jgi:DNA replication protein DnaC
VLAQLSVRVDSALNRVYKHWAGIFNNDAVLTSALLDRVTHHVQTVLIEGKSYRSKDQVEL